MSVCHKRLQKAAISKKFLKLKLWSIINRTVSEKYEQCYMKLKECSNLLRVPSNFLRWYFGHSSPLPYSLVAMGWRFVFNFFTSLWCTKPWVDFLAVGQNHFTLQTKVALVSAGDEASCNEKCAYMHIHGMQSIFRGSKTMWLLDYFYCQKNINRVWCDDLITKELCILAKKKL